MVQPSISQHRSPKVARIRSFCSAGETNWSPETTRPFEDLMSGGRRRPRRHAASKGRNGSRKIKGVAREVGRYRQPAPRLPHHEGERPAGATRRKSSRRTLGRSTRPTCRTSSRAAFAAGAPCTHICSDCLRARRGVVELLSACSSTSATGRSSATLKRPEEGRASLSQALDYVHWYNNFRIHSTPIHVAGRVQGGGPSSRNRPNKCC